MENQSRDEIHQQHRTGESLIMDDEKSTSSWRTLSLAVERLERQYGRRVLRLATAVGLVLVGAVFATLGMVILLSENRPKAPVIEAPGLVEFELPAELDIPDGPQGDAIRHGLEIFTKTGLNAAQYVGSDLSCSNCHLDAGRRAHSSPMWAAWVLYPSYRKKNQSINTMEDRISGCFVYSMNAQYSASGVPPPPGSDIYRDLQAYFYWLAQEAPTGRRMTGAGYPTPPRPVGGYDHTRGAAVYEQYCSACHGADGGGQRNADGSVAIPPVWGDRSYNWGAGMARVDLAAGFIKANMPLGQENTLTDQEAWDVAAFIDSHERPKDPRQKGTIADNARLNFADQDSYYGKVVNGVVLGTGSRGQ